MWLRDYHVDGLRLDAVHALRRHVARRTCSRSWPIEVDALQRAVGRPLTLIAESDLNDPRLSPRARRGGLRPGRAVERRLPPRAARAAHRRAPGLLRRLRLARRPRPRSTTSAFLHDGTLLDVPRPHARPPGRHAPDARPTGSSVCLQNHDQVGNRALGRPARRASLAPRPAARSARRCCSPRRSRRCSSWARSGAPARRGSSSPRIPKPSSPKRRAARRIEEFGDARLGHRRGARPAGPADVSRPPSWTGPSFPPPRIGPAGALPPADRAAADRA